MDVLIIGGTQFLGRHLVDALRLRGHRVTLFNAGHHRNNVPIDVEQIHGDRRHDLERLGERVWDSVIDTCAYVPSHVESAARFLRRKVGQYVLISSVSALDLTQAEPTESTPVLPMPDGASRTEMKSETYGPLKALCEAVAWSWFGKDALVVRPGLIVGPYDPTDRFTYWPVRIARGGTVLAPETPAYAVQFIDARGLADWIVLQTERATGGAFNLTGFPQTITFGDVLSTSARIANSSPEIRWANEAFLHKHQVSEWSDLPLWVSAASHLPGLRNINISQARRTGLQILPLEQTVRDTLRWARGRPRNYRWQAGLRPEAEADVLAKIA